MKALTAFTLAAIGLSAPSLAAETPPKAEVEGADALSVDFGANLRVRQEFMHNVPGLPGGGLLSRAPNGKTRNHMRFRPSVWGEAKAGDSLRLYTRLTDEFRANLRPKSHATSVPDEMIVDNLFLDGTGLFDGLVDFRVGRQDIYHLYGLDHVFGDGTPGDGSRTVFSDMVRATLHVDERSRIDVFALMNRDKNDLRWGTRRCRNRRLTALSPSYEPEMDDWGWGVVWSSSIGEALPYQVFAMEKRTASFHERNGAKHPSTRREMAGAKVCPKLTDEWSLQFEGMSEIGENGRDESILAWSGYAGVNWRSSSDGAKPFASLGLHYMSGDKDAARQDGGRRAWDPMWARSVNDSEMFLYGTHYGAAWWSNMYFAKLSGGVDIASHHRVSAFSGPMYSAADDGLGGGDGDFKGLLSGIRYDFPLYSRKRFEVFGHAYAEAFNPGDYFEGRRGAHFLRWQVDVKF